MVAIGKMSSFILGASPSDSVEYFLINLDDDPEEGGSTPIVVVPPSFVSKLLRSLILILRSLSLSSII